MEKGKSYLMLFRKKKQNLIREVKCLDETKTCFKIKFIPTYKNEFGLDFFKADYKWILKEDLENKFELLEELPESYKGYDEKPRFTLSDPKKQQ